MSKARNNRRRKQRARKRFLLWEYRRAIKMIDEISKAIQGFQNLFPHEPIRVGDIPLPM